MKKIVMQMIIRSKSLICNAKLNNLKMKEKRQLKIWAIEFKK